MIYFLTLVFLVTAFAGSFQPTFQTSGNGPTYVALGDSVAAGIGSSFPDERSYPSRLSALMSLALGEAVRLENFAVPGETAASFVESDQHAALERAINDDSISLDQVVAVTLTLGGNELLGVRNGTTAERAAALATFQATMPAAVDAVRTLVGPETPLFVSTIYDPTGEDAQIEESDAWWIARFNDVIRSATEAGGGQVVDLATAFGADAAALTRYPYDVHPTNVGHERIAQAFWSAMMIDRDAPEVEFLSSTDGLRRSPTLRFSVSPDTLPDSLTVTSTAEQLLIFRPVEVAANEYALLLNATEIPAHPVPLIVTLSDAAGNVTEATVELSFRTDP